jgi:hypothetical protein
MGVEIHQPRDDPEPVHIQHFGLDTAEGALKRGHPAVLDQ